MALHFTATESIFSYFEALSKYLDSHGKPMAFYSDKASVFYVKKRSETAGKDVTQFGRALYEFNIDAFCANTIMGFRCIACSTRIDNPLMPMRKSSGSRCR